jgi:hypothetical protein
MTEDEAWLLDEVAHKRREDVALVYAEMLLTRRDDFDWPTINRAIVERWSQSGLSWIKKRAWQNIAAATKGGRQ